MRSCNSIKLMRAHTRAKLDAIRPKLTPKEIEETLTRKTYEEMFSVDFSNSESFSVSLSFTMLDWRILERIIDDREFDFGNVDMQQILQMCFNVFPRIKSVFHRLAQNQHISDLQFLKPLFEKAG